MARNQADSTERNAATSGQISNLASQVISVLTTRGEDSSSPVRASIVRRLIDAALRSSAFDTDSFIDGLHDSRISDEQIIDIYIPEAARMMGEMWARDELDFAKVTIATARLQGLLTVLSSPWVSDPGRVAYGTNVMLVLQGGDHHTLGPHVAAAQLRRMGATVRMLFGERGDVVVRALLDENYDMVLFSCSQASLLDSIATSVKRIRALCDPVPPLVLGGLVLSHSEDVQKASGVDLVTYDVRLAMTYCEKRLRTPRVLAR